MRICLLTRTFGARPGTRECCSSDPPPTLTTTDCPRESYHREHAPHDSRPRARDRLHDGHPPAAVRPSSTRPPLGRGAAVWAHAGGGGVRPPHPGPPASPQPPPPL